MTTRPASAAPESIRWLAGHIAGYAVPRAQLRAPRVPCIRDLEVVAELPRGSFEAGATVFTGPPSGVFSGGWG